MIPYKKQVYRLLSTEGKPILDLLSIDDESLEHINDPAPKENVPALCRHPFVESKRARVTPTTVMPLLQPVWDMDKGCVCQYPKLGVARAYAMAQVRALRPDTIRHLNPTPYKVRSVVSSRGTHSLRTHCVACFGHSTALVSSLLCRTFVSTGLSVGSGVR